MNERSNTEPADDAQTALASTEGVQFGMVVPVIEEALVVDRQPFETGRGVRLHKRVHDEVVTVDESVRFDEVTVERVPVDRSVDEHPAVRHEGDTMIIPVVAERVVTRVELVLVEEIHVTRKQSSRVVQQDVVLRREEVVVERFGDADPLGRVGPAGRNDAG